MEDDPVGVMPEPIRLSALIRFVVSEVMRRLLDRSGVLTLLSCKEGTCSACGGPLCRHPGDQFVGRLYSEPVAVHQTCLDHRQNLREKMDGETWEPLSTRSLFRLVLAEVIQRITKFIWGWRISSRVPGNCYVCGQPLCPRPRDQFIGQMYKRSNAMHMDCLETRQAPEHPTDE